MRRFTVVCTSLIAAVLLTACNQPPADNHDADVKALKDLEAQWNQDFVSKDAGKLLAHYVEDAVLMAPGMPPSSGKDAVRKTLTDMVGDPALSLKFKSSRVEVAKSGDIGYTQGSYTMTMTDPNSKQLINDHGSYVTTYSKQPDGSWKAVTDIATSEVPPPAPAPPMTGKKK